MSFNKLFAVHEIGVMKREDTCPVKSQMFRMGASNN